MKILMLFALIIVPCHAHSRSKKNMEIPQAQKNFIEVWAKTEPGPQLARLYREARFESHRSFSLANQSTDLESTKRARARFRRMITKTRDLPRTMRGGDASHELPKIVDSAFLGVRTLTDLAEIEKNNLVSATLPVVPWSDTYWPTQKGHTSWRYLDSDFPRYKTWTDVKDYLLKVWAGALTAKEIEYLSPAEKYDLLIGAPRSKGLAYAQLIEPELQGRVKDGNVESWEGLCHGWAPAAFMYQKPLRKIVVKARLNRQEIEVPFYSADVRALGTLLWSNGTRRMNVQWAGGRCDKEESKITFDEKTGAILDRECWDLAPDTFHLALVNQIGKSQLVKTEEAREYMRSFVFDVTYSQQVWNQPIYSYGYKYFNPKTGETFDSIFPDSNDPQKKSPYVSFNDSSYRDKFAGSIDAEQRPLRDPRATGVIGIAMTVEYGVENDPERSDAENIKDLTSTASWTYDLELDDNMKIVGGEWHQKSHPDFMWTLPSKAKPAPETFAIFGNKPYALGRTLSAAERRNALAYARNGIPLTPIVEALFSASRQ